MVQDRTASDLVEVHPKFALAFWIARGRPDFHGAAEFLQGRSKSTSASIGRRIARGPVRVAFVYSVRQSSSGAYEAAVSMGWQISLYRKRKRAIFDLG